ncbi:7-carboxy-7-deazaguanine synthase QueE [Sulfurimonas sp. MAG313]|nr:7-carboxy-7-deazaguanine synthase QueE [Sulfurimonas sp. MAG313]MDF1882259.1 7-carboxy-7-deazaguanine synthase QueE [Sulfurimonas sp. MAG313]
MIYLVEHFYSIQGEGKYLGTPSLFFRFGGCNMKCEGFGCSETSAEGIEIVGCDTVYAVDKKHFGSTWLGIEKLDELISIYNSYTLPIKSDIVMTGGEPLIYANDELFVSFVEFLQGKGHRVTFETNGAINIDFEKFRVYQKCVFALSVKLKNSGEPKSKRINADAIQNIATYSQDAFFKFTVDKESIETQADSEINEIIKYAPSISVYCMPKGGSKNEVEYHCESVINYCKLKGYVYSDRLHIRIWDDNKGV